MIETQHHDACTDMPWRGRSRMKLLMVGCGGYAANYVE